MWLLMLPLLMQSPTARQLLEAEHARRADVSVLMAGVRSSDARIQQLAVRALGRFERPSLRDSIVPLLKSKSVDVRRETVNALGQMNAAYDFAGLLPKETNGRVRAVIYETMGRVTPTATGTETILTTGFVDADTLVRNGAARGMEAFIRKQGRSPKVAPTTIAALHRAVRANRSAELRQLALLALIAAGDSDSPTLAIGLRDPSPQVRRLAVLGSRQWVDDPSPMVRYQALRVAGTCERAMAAVHDRSEHVVLTAIDILGEQQCNATTAAPVLQMVITDGTTWRMRAHALVALARVAPDLARASLATASTAPMWQERVYAAAAARLIKESDILAKLAYDNAPNVAIAAMSSLADARRALTSEHAGLVLAGANQLKGSPELASSLPQLRAAAQRLRSANRSTFRDPLIAITERLREAGDSVPLPSVTDFPIEPLPPDSLMRALEGATVRMRLRGLGIITLELLPNEAPLTVATFVQLAESGKFTGLTFHRIVSNFVIQGGSPGADEYDGVSAGFMRDEVGLARNARGSLGISTRGRDTGDGQIYVNLVDNFRLDHDYTVFARVTSGLDLIDRVQEGDGIQSVEVVRRKGARPR